MIRFMKIFSIVLILIIMADPVWGMLAKSAVDAETVEEAIARLIAVHEADETSHLGTGESLEAHKNADIIDHPAGSILGDKFTNQEVVFSPTFESFDNWSQSGATVQAEPGGLKLGTANTTNAVTYLYAGASYGPIAYGHTVATTLQVVLACSRTTNYLAYMLAGSNELVNDTPGIGFKFLNGIAYGVQAYYSGGSYTEQTISLGSYSANAYHLYRVEVKPDENKAYFYMDSVLIGSLTLNADGGGGLALLTYYVKTTTTDYAYLYSGVPYLSLTAVP